jgi:hypothetical protein
MTESLPTGAIAWELRDAAGAGIRVMVAGRFTGLQSLGASQRPMWAIAEHESAEEAAKAAVRATEYEEGRGSGSTLTSGPTEVVVHPVEAQALRNHGVIPPPLRARIFTALYRNRAAA